MSSTHATRGVAVAALAIIALAGGGAASAATVELQWTLQAEIPVGSTDNLAPGVTLAVDEAAGKVYAASFAVPFGDPPTGGFSIVQVIDGATDSVIESLDLGDPTLGIPDQFVADPTTHLVYLPLQSGTVQIIDGNDDTLGTDIPMPDGAQPWGAAVNPATQRVYVTDGASEDGQSGAIYVIDAATETVLTTIGGLDFTLDSPGLDPDQGKMYVPVQAGDYVLVVSIAGADENQVIAGIYGDDGDFDVPSDIAMDPSRSRGYVRNGSTVTTIDTVSDAVVGDPLALGDPANDLLTGLTVDAATNTLFANRVSLGGDADAVLLAVDVGTGAVTATVPVAADSLDDVVVNSQTGTVYVAGSRGSDSFVWVYRLADVPPAPTPTPSPSPELAPTGAPSSGPAVVGAAAALLAGVAAIVIRARRTSGRRRTPQR